MDGNCECRCCFCDHGRGDASGFGATPWIEFLTYTSRQQKIVLENWSGLIYFIVPSGFMQGRLLDFDVRWAYASHLIVALVGIWFAVRAWPGRAEQQV